MFRNSQFYPYRHYAGKPDSTNSGSVHNVFFHGRQNSLNIVGLTMEPELLSHLANDDVTRLHKNRNTNPVPKLIYAKARHCRRIIFKLWRAAKRSPLRHKGTKFIPRTDTLRGAPQRAMNCDTHLKKDIKIFAEARSLFIKGVRNKAFHTRLCNHLLKGNRYRQRLTVIPRILSRNFSLTPSGNIGKVILCSEYRELGAYLRTGITRAR